MTPEVVREVQHQYVVMLPEDLRTVPEQRRNQLLNLIVGALNLLFGLDLQTPVRISARFGERFQLLEAAGDFPRVAEPAEITGAWAGVIAAWSSGPGRNSQFTDLLNPRATN